MEDIERPRCGHGECGRYCKHTWKPHSHHTLGGGLWFIGWLFTIGYLKLPFWYGVLAIIIWPYFLGVHFSPLP